MTTSLISPASVAELDQILGLIGTTLEITATQRALAEGHYLAIARFLGGIEDAPFARYEPQIYLQGSVRLGTTVKPILDVEYDVDLVYELQVDYRHIPRPVVLLDMIETRLKQNEMYRPKVERKNRCVRVNYSGQFHLDILPAAVDDVCGGTCVRVPDRSTQAWKASNPKGYAAWFESRAVTPESGVLKASVEPLPAAVPHQSKASLQRTVQLVKRLRDISFAGEIGLAPISIVLTTLAGHHYGGHQSVSLAIAQTLDRVVESIPNQGRLYVHNPSNLEEDLSERWDADRAAYRAFCFAVREWRDRWRTLLDLRGIDRVTAELERMFGPAPVRKAIEEQVKALETARDQGRLGVGRTGIVTTAISPSVTPVPRNTFFGE